MEKSPDAFRTISEVAEWLGVEAHVLRFWETKFAQVKPVKRAGGRRYYRPADMALLGGIRRLLHDDGLTIRGVQKILRERGVSHVAGLSPNHAVDGVATAAAPRRRRASTPQTGRREAARAAAPAGDGKAAALEASAAVDDAPPLPFDMPAAEVPAAVKPAARPRRDGAGLDRDEAERLLRRARDLVQRLSGRPE